MTKRWFAVARSREDPDPVDFFLTTSQTDAAQMSASRRGKSIGWKVLVVELSWPHGHQIEPGGPTPSATEFNVPPLEESSTITDVLNEARREQRQRFGRVTIRKKCWVNDSLSVKPA